MKAYAVIGAGFGDEGKGLITDYMVRRLGSKVVGRFNGGAQASHTVQTPDGKRHVFSHVGAGTFAGASTFLGRRFIVNPYILDKEMAELARKGFEPTIWCHEDAPVTTIFDMALNAAAELARGAGRHGSCGIGINETVTRGEAGFYLSASDVRYMSRARLKGALKAIRENWVPQRLKELGLDEDDMPSDFHLKTGEILRNDNYEEHVVRLLLGMTHLNIGWDIGEYPLDVTHLVMEGAQGLMLDEELGAFPHVTRSLTGLPNAIDLVDHTGYGEVQPIYVTRAYATRHGAGELKHERQFITDAQLPEDRTNVPNQWQGTIRYAPLDLCELKRFITADLARADQKKSPRSSVRVLPPIIALTCLDQLGPFVRVYDTGGHVVTIESDYLPDLVTKQLGVTVGLVSRGPTFTDVEPRAEIGV